MNIILTESVTTMKTEYQKRYKCPYCEVRLDRLKLIDHVEKDHQYMIPKGYTPTRVVFNTINKKDHGNCIMCRSETKWDEDKGRYERICDKPSCNKGYETMVNNRIKNKLGKTREELMNDSKFQAKMLSGRSISGTYKFSDGGTRTYTGKYEKNFLEFMDIFLKVKSIDIESPGPVIEYTFEGKVHKWITDFYYEPYNLVFDIKDGGDNPNNREMKSYRQKQIEKEKAIKNEGKYNYIRLTDNKFEQLILLMMELKELYIENMKAVKPIIRINEGSSIINESDIYDKKENTGYIRILNNYKDPKYCNWDEELTWKNIEDALTDDSIDKTKDLYVYDMNPKTYKVEYIGSIEVDGDSYSWVKKESVVSEGLIRKLIIPIKIRKYNKDHNTPINGIADILKKHYNPGLRYYITHCNDIDELRYMKKDTSTIIYTAKKIKERIHLVKQYGECPKTKKYYKGIMSYINKGVTEKDCDITLREISSDIKRISDRIKTLSHTKSVNESSSIINESNVDKRKIIDTVIKTFTDLGCKPNINKKEKERYIKTGETSFGDSLCIAALGNENLSKNCSAVNKVIKPMGGSVRPDNYGTAFLRVHESTIIKSSSIHLEDCSITMGTMPAANPDNVYIVNYLPKNSFSGNNDREDMDNDENIKNIRKKKMAICRDFMSDIHIVDGDKVKHISLEEFKDISDTHDMWYWNKPTKQFFKIVESAENDKDFYRLLTEEEIDDPDDIKYNTNFKKQTSLLEQLNLIQDTIKATILNEYTNNVNGIQVPILPLIPYNSDISNINYYRDINGIFVQNEMTGLRSKSYESLEDITESVVNCIYTGEI